MTTKKKILIKGPMVHGVGYRPFLLRKARRLSIPNYDAENIIEDGQQIVVILVGGDESSVYEFADFVKKTHPLAANVSNVDVEEFSDEIMPIDAYQSLLSAEQQSKLIQAGLGMLGKQDQTITEIRELKTETNDNFGRLGVKMGIIGTSVENLTDTTQNNFNTLNTKYDVISQTMNKIFGELVEERKQTRHDMKELTGAILTLAKSKA